MTPPTWRADLLDPADLVEDVVRLEGYEAIPSTLPTPPPGTGLTERQRTRRSIGRALAGYGLVEVLTYPFVAPSVWDQLGLADDDPRRRALRLVNPISEAEPELRTTLLPGLLATVRRNVGRGLRDVAVYETGPGLPALGPAAAAAARRGLPAADRGRAGRVGGRHPGPAAHVAVALTGAFDPPGWWGRAGPRAGRTRSRRPGWSRPRPGSS